MTLAHRSPPPRARSLAVAWVVALALSVSSAWAAPEATGAVPVRGPVAVAPAVLEASSGPSPAATLRLKVSPTDGHVPPSPHVRANGHLAVGAAEAPGA